MDTLKDTLNLVNDWLKFAEAKNAILVTASGMALWAVTRLLLTIDLSFLLSIYFVQLVVFLFLGFITALLSFLPVLIYKFIIPKKGSLNKPNLLYFGYLSTLSKHDLIKRVINATGYSKKDIVEFDEMYAEQIIINSRIAMAKYSLFERSVSLIIIGALTPVIGGLLLFFAKNKRNKIDGFG